MPKINFLFYISQNYSFEILRPLQTEIQKCGHDIAWFCQGKEVNQANFTESEVVLKTVSEVVKYNPEACFVPGNIIPNFIPGIKVQVFHGLEWKKKGHFVIRDCFDLYCTHGRATTLRFNELARKHKNFDVKETGWPKLDNLFTTPPKKFFDNNKVTLLYAPTFSPSLTSAPDLLCGIKELVAQNKYNWLVKFHPKMNRDFINEYKAIVADNYKIIDTSNINELLQSADIMISDTSSVIGEFSLLGKPVITLNNSNPGSYLINLTQANELPHAIEQALVPSAKLLKAIRHYADDLHPHNDGKSSSRILNSVEEILINGKAAAKSLPRNLFRNLKQRKNLKYWQ